MRLVRRKKLHSKQHYPASYRSSARHEPWVWIRGGSVNVTGRYRRPKENAVPQVNLAKLILLLLATAIVVLTPASSDAQRGRGRGRGSDGLPPGHERKAEPVSVPEPATVTLLALGIGGGRIARARRRGGWTVCTTASRARGGGRNGSPNASPTRPHPRAG